MRYNQKVLIKNQPTDKVINAFHNIKFVKFLMLLQPIRIINWDGIENKQKAAFYLWFFGWRKFEVEHSNYKKSNNQLSFIDQGLKLPLGIKTWHHEHIVKTHNKGTLIIDKLKFSHSQQLTGFLIYPLLVFPIFIRHILYKIYFFNK
tara:strand:+ start:190 stop:630 length:441 start_codon:yes stop_codon:yes gene_type:complete